MKGTRGIRAGSGGVYRPHNRPNVEAAVSAQDKLLNIKKCQEKNLDEKNAGGNTYIRIDTVAISIGKQLIDIRTPIIYHITPFTLR